MLDDIPKHDEGCAGGHSKHGAENTANRAAGQHSEDANHRVKVDSAAYDIGHDQIVLEMARNRIEDDDD